jgi:hypothetical protein
MASTWHGCALYFAFSRVAIAHKLQVPGLLEYVLAHTQGFADSLEFASLTTASPALPHPEKWMLEFFHADYDLPKGAGRVICWLRATLMDWHFLY